MDIFSISLDLKRNLFYAALLILTSLFSTFSAFSQQTLYLEDWASTDGEADDFFNNVVSTTDASNNIYIAASVSNSYDHYDLLVTKYDKLGTELWSAQYNETTSGDAIAGAITLDDSGNVLVTGTVMNGTNHYDLFVIKYNGSGTEQWHRLYNGTVSLYDGGKELVCDSNDYIYVTGGSFDNLTHSDMVTICYNASGVQQWVSTYDSNSLHDGGAALLFQNDTTIVVSGPTQTATDHWEYAAVKYHTNTGAEITATVTLASGSTMDEFTALAIDENENVYLTGSVKDATTGFFDYKTFKLDAGLQILWEKVYAGSAGKNDMARAIGVDDSGNVYVSGFSVNGNGDKDYLTIKYNASGTTQWTKKYDGLSDDEANSLAINEDNELFVTGYTSKLGNRDYYTLLYDSNGNELWSARYNGLYNKNDVAKTIEIDDEGNILVSGHSEDTSKTVYLTVKYARHELITPPDDEPLSKGFTYTENRGQIVDTAQNQVPGIKFYNTQNSPSLYFFDDKISLVLTSIDTAMGTLDTMHRVDIGFDKSGPRNVGVKALEKRQDYYNFYKGHIPEGREEVPLYDRLIYTDVFEGIDLMMASNYAGAKYYFICKPGSHPDSISLTFNGQESLSLSNGDLHIGTLMEDMILPEATAFQIDGNGNAVSTAWTPTYSINGGKVAFSSGSFNSGQTLVIRINHELPATECDAGDTGILYSTYYGGGMFDHANDITAGDYTAQLTENGSVTPGDVYIVGDTGSSDFPAEIGGLIMDLQGAFDAFVIAIDGFARLWVTHFGGNNQFDGSTGSTTGASIAYDITNEYVYFTGRTNCKDFPVTGENEFPVDDYIGTPLTANMIKAYLVKLNVNGQMIYATYFGGETNTSRGLKLDISSEAHVFLGGYSVESPDLEDNGNTYYQDSNNDGYAFIAEFDTESRLIWSTRFSGSDSVIRGLVVDKEDDLIVVGDVSSEGASSTDFKDFDIQNPNDFYETVPEGDRDAFIAKFAITESDRELVWSTLFAGSEVDYGAETGVNSKNEIYFIGVTRSTATSFPIAGNYLDNVNECTDIFITRFSANAILDFSSFYGGSKPEGIGGDCTNGFWGLSNNTMDLDFDTKDNVYITSNTASTDFSTTPFSQMYYQDVLGYMSPPAGTDDAFIIMLSNNMNKKWVTYFGGKKADEAVGFPAEEGTGIAVVNNRLYLTGRTDSTCPQKIPLKDHNEANYFQGDLVGGADPFISDAFITVFDIEPVLTTSTEDVQISNNELSVYPSPGHTVLTIELNKMIRDRVFIEIFDILGNPLYSKAVNPSVRNKVEVDVSDFVDGIYIVSINNGTGGRLAKPIIISH